MATPQPEPDFDIFAAFCPSRDVFAELADKWSLLILLSLNKLGGQRFSELQRSVGGVSRKMLTQSLRSLERDGLVLRTVHPETPPRVVYALRPLGRALAEKVVPVAQWVEDNSDEVMSARTDFDEARGLAAAPVSAPVSAPESASVSAATA